MSLGFAPTPYRCLLLGSTMASLSCRLLEAVALFWGEDLLETFSGAAGACMEWWAIHGLSPSF